MTKKVAPDFDTAEVLYNDSLSELDMEPLYRNTLQIAFRWNSAFCMERRRCVQNIIFHAHSLCENSYNRVR